MEIPGFSGASGPLPGWKLEDAKSQFDDLVRRARDSGPQRVTATAPIPSQTP